MVNPGNLVYRKNPALQRIYFGSPYNLIHSGRSGDLQKYYQRLCDFKFLLGKIQHSEFGVQALIEDYDLLDDSELEKHPCHNPEAAKELRLIRGALRLSAHVLVEEPTQLASQLWGRLQDFDMSNIQSLLQQAKQNPRVWLYPLKSNLIPPDRGLLRILAGHQGSVNTVAVSSDGKQVVSGSEDGTLKVWNLATGKELVTLTGHKGAVTVIAVIPNGKQVISGSEDGTLKVWDLVKGQELFTLAKDKHIVGTLAVTSDCKWVILASLRKGRIFLGSRYWVTGWNLETREEKVFLSKSKDTVTLTPNGSEAILFSSIKGEGPAAMNVTINPLNPANSKRKFYIAGVETNITLISITPDGKQAISSSGDKTLIVWDLAAGQIRFVLTGHHDEITAVAITPDGKQAVSGSKDKTLKLWDLEIGKEKATLISQSNLVNSIVITPDCKQAISGSKDTTLKIWDIEKEESSHLFEHNNLTSNSAENQDANITHSLGCFELLVCIIIIPILFLLLTVICLILPFFLYLLCCYFLLFPIVTCICRRTFKINIIDFNRCSKQFPKNPKILKKIGESIEIYNYNSFLRAYLKPLQNSYRLKYPYFNFNCKQLINLNSHSASITALAVTSDNKKIISGSNDKTLRVWELETREHLFILNGHQDRIVSFALTPNSKLLISSSFDKIINVWDTESLNKIFSLKSWISIIYDAFHIIVDGIFIIIGIDLFVWITGFYTSTETFILLIFFAFLFAFLPVLVSFPYFACHGITDANNCDKDSKVIVTPDGTKAISGSRDKTLKVWDLTTHRQIIALRGHKDWITSMAVTSDGYLISGSKDKTLKIWKLITCKELFTLTNHIAPVTCVGVTPDGLQIISASSDGILKIWNIETREEVRSINGHRSSVEAIADSLESGTIHQSFCQASRHNANHDRIVRRIVYQMGSIEVLK